MRRVAWIWAALLLCAPFAMLASPAQAASGACTSNKGVTVVVDYGPLGGGVAVRCAANADGSGLSALHAAGFSTQGTIKDGPGVVCRINDKPSAAQEECRATPPTSAYWHYWHASNGGSWAYSQSGAANRRVTAGGFEGWTFTSAKPGVRPVRSGGSKAGASGTSGSNGSTSGSDGSRGSGASGATGGDEVLKKPSSSEDSALPQPKPRSKKTASQPSADSSEEATSAETRDKSATTDAGGNSATPWIAGAIILALVAAIAATQTRRRRH